MTKRSLLICTSIAALTIASGSAMAESERTSPGGGGGAPTEMAPPSKSGDGMPSRRMQGAGEGSAEAQPGAHARESEGNTSRNRAEGSNREKPAKNAGDESRRNKDGRDGSASTGASEGESGRDMPRSADKEKAGKRSKDAADDASRHGNASSGASEGAEGKDHRPTDSVTKLTGEKRSKAQSAFRSHRSEAVVKDVNIDVSVGVVVPRTVRLYAVPEDVIVIAPEYRSYKYFIYEDKVVIVDPATYDIIDVLILT